MKEAHFVHPTAIVDQGVTIGAGTKIWHFSHLMPESSIGRNCILGQNVFIDQGVRIGNGVKIQNNVSVYKGVMVEDFVFLGPSMVFTNVLNPRSFLDRKSEFTQTIVREGATLGANVTVVCGCEIGKYAMVGAGSVVTENIRPFALAFGNPAKQRGWVSKNAYPLIFNEQNEGICPFSHEKYILKDNKVEFLK